MIDMQSINLIGEKLQELVVEYEDQDERIDTVLEAMLYVVDNGVMFHGEVRGLDSEEVNDVYGILYDLLDRV